MNLYESKDVGWVERSEAHPDFRFVRTRAHSVIGALRGDLRSCGLFNFASRSPMGQSGFDPA